MQIQLQHSGAQQIIDKLMSHEGHLSFSSLSAFADSPQTFIQYKLAKTEPTDSMRFGAMVHCLVLEPHEFESRYFCLDDLAVCNSIGGAKPRATKAYKEWKEGAMAEAGDKELVDADDYELAQRMGRAVRSNRASAKILAMCPEHEVEINWEFENFLFKGFIDGKGEKAKMDLKVYADASPKKFQRSIIDNKLYLQAAMYTYAIGKDEPYYIVAVDRSLGVSVHKIHAHLLEHGMNEYKTLIDRFNECIIKEHWDRSHDFYSELTDGTFICEKPGWLY